LKPDKICRVRIDFLFLKRSKVCHTYTVNHWKELVETWQVDGVTRSAPCGLKGIGKKTMEI